MPFSLRPVRITGSRPLFLLSLAAVATMMGCRPQPPAVKPIVSIRSTAPVSGSVVRIQSTPLFRQAAQACKQHDYRHAAELLQALANTPDLPPDAIAFVQQQRDICLKDAGLLPTASAVASPAAHPPADADCGPRALLIACRKLGVKTDLEALRLAAGTTVQGTTLAGLQQAAHKLGLRADGIQVSREALPDVDLPALAWVHRDHYVALLGLSGSGEHGTATIHDPNHSAEETLSQEQLLQRSGGYLLLLHR